MSILRILARHAGSGKGPKPIRIDGRGAVTGAARYPSDMGAPNPA